MSVYVMSDIHGLYDKYKAMLKKIHFNKDRDYLYILGDVIDRGPDSIKMLTEIMEQENITVLLGNHELLMYEAYNATGATDKERKFNATCSLQTWHLNGGYKTDADFNNLSVFDRTNIMDYIYRAPVVIPNLQVSGKTYYLAHSTYLNVDLANIRTKNLTLASLLREVDYKEIERVVWEREYPFKNVQESKAFKGNHASVLVAGHTITKRLYKEQESVPGHIFYGHKGHYINIDCGCAAYSIGKAFGRLGCLRLDDGAEFYT